MSISISIPQALSSRYSSSSLPSNTQTFSNDRAVFFNRTFKNRFFWTALVVPVAGGVVTFSAVTLPVTSALMITALV